MHFSGDESGMQWEDYLFELQNAVEWRMVMSRGTDERAQVHAMSMLINTCEDDRPCAHRHGRQLDTAGGASKNSGTERLV